MCILWCHEGYSDLIDMDVKDVSWHKEGIVLKLWNAKNDTWRKGQEVCLAWGAPTEALLEYMELMNSVNDKNLPLFVKTHMENKNNGENARVEYPRLREQLLSLCDKLGWKERQLCRLAFAEGGGSIQGRQFGGARLGVATTGAVEVPRGNGTLLGI